MRRRLREQLADAQRNITARKDMSGRETRRYSRGGGGGSPIQFDTPVAVFGATQVKGTSLLHSDAEHQHGFSQHTSVRLQGTTPSAGGSGYVADAEHQHGIWNTGSGKANGTFYYTGGKGYMVTASGNIPITHLS